MPPDASNVPVVACSHRCEQLQIRPRERPVAVDRGDQERPDSLRVEATHELDRRLARVLEPPGDPRRALERVGRQADAVAVPGDDLGERRGISQCERAHEHAVDARRERVLDGLGGAEPATHLELAALARDEPVEQRAMGLAANAAARRVEVDHVEPARACRCEPVGERLRVASEVGRGVETSLDEPHDAASSEIDGGDDIQAASPYHRSC